MAISVINEAIDDSDNENDNDKINDKEELYKQILSYHSCIIKVNGTLRATQTQMRRILH